MKATFTAEYYSHETTGIETITQEFEGDSFESIGYEYFGIYGDTLGRLLDENGVEVYENMAEVYDYIKAYRL